jgi:hypothetical protein
MRFLSVPHCVALSALLILAPARADSLYDAGGNTYLDIGRFTTDFRYADGDHEGHVGRYGVAFEEPLADDVTFGLHGGYLTWDAQGEPPAAPLDFSGRYLGVLGRYHGSRGDYFNLAAEFSYTWHDVDSVGFASARSEVTWYETWASFGPLLRAGRWRLGFGGYYQGFDGGTETDTNPGRHAGFEAARHTGAYVGLTFYVDPTGSFSIIGTTGARRGLKLVFKREF